MTDNCNVTKNGRKKYEIKSGSQAVGCSSHGANGMNKGLFKLEENKQVQERMDAVQNGIKGTQFGAFVKKEVARDEVIEEMKKSDASFDASQSESEIQRRVTKKMDSKSFGIPSAGNTRHWNNQYKIADWQLRNKNSILRLYVFLSISSFVFCTFFFLL